MDFKGAIAGYETALLVAVIVIFAVFVGLMIYRDAGKRRSRKPYVRPVYAEIARIEETTTFSGGAVASGILLALHNIVMVFGFFAGAKSAVQEASIGTMWIAGNVLFGVCMLAGRHRRYRVLREQPPEEPST